jgi:SAM-dependent methyltransferase
VGLSERQKRERAYYEEYAKRAVDDVSFDAVDGPERRPFNPYWHALALVRSALRTECPRLLDVGCGAGEFSVMCARLGFDVHGVDVSSENVRRARELAAKYHVDDRTHFAEGVAEYLDFQDDFFDVLLGIDILHHIDIEPAARELHRVLKPGGVAIFKEPIESPLFEPLRNSRFGLWLAPKEASFERHITEDERKLTPEDLERLRQVFPEMNVDHFRVFSRLAPLFGRLAVEASGASRLERVDRWLLTAMPWLRELAGIVVIQARKAA